MPRPFVVKMQGTDVIQKWMDVTSIAEWVAKYGPDPGDLQEVEADKAAWVAPGTQRINGNWQNPVRNKPVKPESKQRRMFKALITDPNLSASTKQAIQQILDEA